MSFVLAGRILSVLLSRSYLLLHHSSLPAIILQWPDLCTACSESNPLGSPNQQINSKRGATFFRLSPASHMVFYHQPATDSPFGHESCCGVDRCPSFHVQQLTPISWLLSSFCDILWKRHWWLEPPPTQSALHTIRQMTFFQDLTFRFFSLITLNRRTLLCKGEWAKQQTQNVKGTWRSAIHAQTASTCTQGLSPGFNRMDGCPIISMEDIQSGVPRLLPWRRHHRPCQT